MKLYLISQNVNNNYDTYDSAVVAATNEKEAQKMLPYGYMDDEDQSYRKTTWVTVKDVEVALLGTAKPGTKAGVICASFNAG